MAGCVEACAGRHPHEADATWIMFMRAASGWSVKRDCSTEDPLGNCPDTAWGRGEGGKWRVACTESGHSSQEGGDTRRTHLPRHSREGPSPGLHSDVLPIVKWDAFLGRGGGGSACHAACRAEARRQRRTKSSVTLMELDWMVSSRVKPSPHVTRVLLEQCSGVAWGAGGAGKGALCAKGARCPTRKAVHPTNQLASGRGIGRRRPHV